MTFTQDSAQPAPAAQSKELTPLQFDILRTAVTKAKQYQVRKAKDLRERLQQLYPGLDADIDAALAFWGGYEQDKRVREYASGRA